MIQLAVDVSRNLSNVYRPTVVKSRNGYGKLCSGFH